MKKRSWKNLRKKTSGRKSKLGKNVAWKKHSLEKPEVGNMNKGWKRRPKKRKHIYKQNKQRLKKQSSEN